MNNRKVIDVSGLKNLISLDISQLKYVCPIVFFFFISTSLAQQREIFKLTPEHGLSHSTVYDIIQDKEGFIWIATGEGLDKYDSHTIYTYRNEAIGQGFTQIKALQTIGDNLLVGTNKGLYSYNPSLDNFCLLNDSNVAIGSINRLYCSEDKKIYICSKNGLFTINATNYIESVFRDKNVRAVCDYRADVYFVALDDQIILINRLGETLKSYKYPERPNAPSPSGFYVSPTLFKDKGGDIWLGSLRGLFRYDPEADKFIYESFAGEPNQLEANVVRAIAEDEDDLLWIGTEYGVYVYNRTTRKSLHYNQSFYNTPTNLSDKAIHSLYRSKENIMWIGTYFGGLNYAKPVKNGFNKLLPGEVNTSLAGKAISQIIQSKNGKIWLGTEDGGITIYDRKKNSYGYLKHSKTSGPSLSSNNVHALLEDHLGQIWIGTFLGGLNRFDPNTKEIKVYKNERDDTSSISNDHVYSLLQPSPDKLLIGTQYGLNMYDYSTDSFSLHLPETFRDKFIYDLLLDSNGAIWVCTSRSGIFRIDSSGKISNYTAHVSNGLFSNEVIAAYEDSLGQLWFCTYSGGLFKWNPDTQSFLNIGKEQGLANNTVYGILEAKNGYFISTNAGLDFYDGKLSDFTHYTISDGLSSNQFNYNSSYKDNDGWMYFGSVNGVTYFHPDSLKLRNTAVGLHFTGLKIFNEDVAISEKSVLKKHINKLDTLTLKHNENAITIEFTEIDHIAEGDNSYAYYLEGYESDWIYGGENRSAKYTNLPHGEYIFHLKSQNNASAGSRLGNKKLFIQILPPFWLTNWAYAIYVFLFLCIVYSSYRFLRFIQNKNLALQLERLEKEKMQEINHHKLNFFTFISHEFKTPLTLIIAAIEELSVNISLSGDHYSFFSIKQNAKKLHHLVQQLIKFRKVEADHERLELSKGDVVLFLSDTFYAFNPLFNHKKLTASFSSNTKESTSYFDAEKLETIVSNLLSNAIKNTKPLGKIEMKICISKNSDYIKITISDTGKGLSDYDRKNLFIPFESQSKKDKTGSGIGLALVKSLVVFLEGTINFDSIPEKGSVFSVNLPLHQNPRELSDIVQIDGNKSMDVPSDLIISNEIYDNSIPQYIKTPEGNKNFSMLIVEDNRELITFLHKHFSTAYKVMMAKNGKDALAKMQKIKPDIILSDIRMPSMDGFTLCKIVKQSEKTSHIPFLMLTGQSDEKDKLNGLEFGANAVIDKPFNIKELDLLVKNLLASNNNLQERFSSILQKKSDQIPKNNKDREFLLKITDLVEAHYENPDFSTGKLSELVGISRSLLHVKMTELTGKSTSKFIKNIRMEKASVLLQEGYSVSEVAFMVGYEPSYFSRAFKKHFKTPPSKYLPDN